MEWVRIEAGRPEMFLAWDEAFLEECEESGREWLWFWESDRPFVVVGYGQSVAREVDEARCEELGVPVLRRCSGGGAVVQGRGCLNFGVVLRMEGRPELETIRSANEHIMSRQRRALGGVLGEPEAVEVKGHTDLAWRGKKFSGNAQRRRRRSVLFHGTFLLGLELRWVAETLRSPSIAPEYRGGRGHLDFVMNLGLGASEVERALIEEWGAVEARSELPRARAEALAAGQYADPAWNRKR